MGLDRAFLAMLTHDIVLDRFDHEDQWGNTVYAASENIKGFVEPMRTFFGSQDRLGKQDYTIVSDTNVVCDAIGIGPRDRMHLAGDNIVFVTEVTLARDDKGQELFQNVTVESREKG